MTKPSIVLMAGDEGIIDPKQAGAVVAWTLPKMVDHSELVAALKAGGIPHIPEETTNASALNRMVCDLFQKKDQLVRACQNNPEGTKKPAYAVLPRRDGQGKMAFEQEWVVGVASDPGTGKEIAELCFDAACPPPVIEEMQVVYPMYLSSLGASDISSWLVALVKNYLTGIPTLGGSGMYFVGPVEALEWRKLRGILADFGIVLDEWPAMRSDQLMETVLRSVKDYTEKASAELEKDLQKYLELAADPKARKAQTRVLTSRMGDVDKQLAVVKRYEKLFDANLSELRESLDGLRAGFGKIATVSTEG